MCCLELARALPVDVEQHVLAGRERGHHRRLRRGVEVAVHLGPFEQLAGRLHALERGRVDERVVAAVDLAAPRLARGHAIPTCADPDRPPAAAATAWSCRRPRARTARAAARAALLRRQPVARLTQCSAPARASGR